MNHYVKSYGHLCQILAFLMMSGLQIWPCHVTQEANFEKNYFFLILHLILGETAKFLVEKLSTLEVISQKPHRGGKHPPVLLGLSFAHLLSLYTMMTTETRKMKCNFQKHSHVMPRFGSVETAFSENALKANQQNQTKIFVPVKS